MDLEEVYFKRVEALEAEYVKKNQTLETLKHQHLEEVVLREEAEALKMVELEGKWKKKLEEQEAHSKTKVAQIEQLNTEKLVEKEHENQLLRDQIEQLMERLAEKDKLITVLYPKTS